MSPGSIVYHKDPAGAFPGAEKFFTGPGVIITLVDRIALVQWQSSGQRGHHSIENLVPSPVKPEPKE